MRTVIEMPVIAHGPMILSSKDVDCSELTFGYVDRTEDRPHGGSVFFYPEEAKALRDALIELYPLEAASQPAEPENPKPRFVVTEEGEYKSRATGTEYVVKPGVRREEPSIRQVLIGTFETKADAEAYAELMNSK